MIEYNEIFVDGDKDIFLKLFIEPQLKSISFSLSKEKVYRPSTYNEVNPDNAMLIDGQIEIFHYFPKFKMKATAIFEPATGKVIYQGEVFNRPSAAAIRANLVTTQKRTSLNGWIFWKYIDVNGIERSINEIKNPNVKD